jgi:hypothetical protein
MILVKLLYWPIGVVAGMLGAHLAGRLFKRAWRLAGREGEPPEAKAQGFGLIEIMAAATVKGAVFGGVKALVDQLSARGFARATGVWPGAKADGRRGGS